MGAKFVVILQTENYTKKYKILLQAHEKYFLAPKTQKSDI